MEMDYNTGGIILNPGLITLFGVRDIGTFLAYMTILGHLVFAAKRSDLPRKFRLLLRLSAFFLIFGGLGRLISFSNIWFSSYLLEGTWGAVTAAVSIATAIGFFRNRSYIISPNKRLAKAYAEIAWFEKEVKQLSTESRVTNIERAEEILAKAKLRVEKSKMDVKEAQIKVGGLKVDYELLLTELEEAQKHLDSLVNKKEIKND